jgi:hypothetical protein
VVLLWTSSCRPASLGSNVAHQGGEERLATSCPPQSPGRSLRHLTSPAAGWVIRDPLVAMALVALPSVACEAEQAATPPAATSSPSHRGRSQPSAFANAWPLCRCGYPSAHRREPGREHVPLRQGSLSAHQHQAKEKAPTFDLRAGAIIDGGDGGFHRHQRTRWTGPGATRTDGMIVRGDHVHDNYGGASGSKCSTGTRRLRQRVSSMTGEERPSSVSVVRVGASDRLFGSPALIVQGRRFARPACRWIRFMTHRTTRTSLGELGEGVEVGLVGPGIHRHKLGAPRFLEG